VEPGSRWRAWCARKTPSQRVRRERPAQDDPGLSAAENHDLTRLAIARECAAMSSQKKKEEEPDADGQAVEQPETYVPADRCVCARTIRFRVPTLDLPDALGEIPGELLFAHASHVGDRFGLAPAGGDHARTRRDDFE
jgi:hypothetical protein